MKVVLRLTDSGPPDQQLFVSLDEAPAAVPHAGQVRGVDIPSCEEVEQSLAFGTTEPVKEVGRQLLASLTRHEAIDMALQLAKQHAELCPIYLRFKTEPPTSYPWETLYDDDGQRFLALEQRWPIARIPDFNPGDTEVRYFSSPLRVLAVLSAVGVPAEPEWRALWDALRELETIPFELHVVAGQHSVKAEIEALGDPRITVSLLTDREVLKRAMQAAKPHLVHLFCHGRTAESPMLMLGNPQDHAAVLSSIVLEADDLRGLAPTSWLLTLNCCEGARDAPGVPSLAHLLVAAGYPAVVGMREPLSSADAHLFTRTFYASLVGQLDELLRQGTAVEVELATMLHASRRALRDQFVPKIDPSQAAAEQRNWTLPVLYVRPEPLMLHPAPLTDGAQAPAGDTFRRQYHTAFLDTVRRARLELHTGTPPAIVARLDAKIAELQHALEVGV